MTLAEDVLELARWTPSGDNSQPWRFKLTGEREFDVYGFDTRAHCVYDLDGVSSRLAHGMLLESLAIAATTRGCATHVEMPPDEAAMRLRYRVRLDAVPGLAADPLASVLGARTVQRRPMRTRTLTPAQRASLERAAQPFRIGWFESLPARARIAALCARNARIRLTIPEAYAVHRSVIAWHATTSEDRLPDASLGANALLLAMMRTAMVSWERLDRLNRWTGTLLPRFALDFVPGLGCSAQMVVFAERAPASLADRVGAGRAIQRLWLTATNLGLQMQPQYTPLVFARYARDGRAFTTVAAAHAAAGSIARRLDDVLGGNADKAVWLARIGPARSVRGRSLRLPLSKLLVADPPPELPSLEPDRTTRS